MKTTYTPTPVDTSTIILPEEYYPLREMIAANVHDNWAKARILQGWTWGPERNDTLLQHPCLVRYEDLPESEKEYDRRSAEETLKLILKLGFDIKKK